VTAGQSGYVDVEFGFTGRFLDDETGLQNNLNRWYDASTGQWISEDPIGFAAGDANLNRYVGNEPMIETDPRGLTPQHPEAEAEKQEIIRLARKWFDDYKNFGRGWPQETCDQQSISLYFDIKGPWKHWDVRGVKGWAWTVDWPPGYWLFRTREAENAVGVFPKPGNPLRPFVIDPFHGYQNQTTEPVIYDDIEDFFRNWPRGRNEDAWNLLPPKKPPTYVPVRCPGPPNVF
jgi:RHS repeat-associated protein